MADGRQKRRISAGIFLGVGVVMTALAFTGSRYNGQRVLYIIAGVLFIIAAIIRFRQAGSEPGV